MPIEICEDDYTMTPSGRLGGRTSVGQYGKHLGEFDTTDEALEFIGQHMEDNQFFPTIFWVSDHGNFWPVDLDGKEIHVEDDEEDDVDLDDDGDGDE